MLPYTGFSPQAQDEGVPALSLDQLIIRNPSQTIFARMRGNAMHRSGIRHGDVLVIEAAEHYKAGIIVCVFANHEAIVRRMDRAANGFELVASHPDIPKLPFEESFIIRGQVIATVRLLARPRKELPVVT